MAKQEDPIERLLKKGVRCLLTDRDVAEMLGVKPTGMRQRRHKHPETLPPSFLLGKCHRYDPDEVRAWIETMKRKPQGGAGT